VATGIVEDHRFIDIRQWHLQGRLKPGQSFPWSWQRNGGKFGSIQVEVEPQRVVIRYELREPGRKCEEVEELVYLDFSPCNYGGQRPWFLCPDCSRRSAVLYWRRNFSCRRCHGLVYETQQVSRWKRALRRMEKIRMRLGGARDIVAPLPPKPPRMRWSTYQRLAAEEQKAASEHLAELEGGIAQLGKSIETLLARAWGRGS
jgi:hypothetical protein